MPDDDDGHDNDGQNEVNRYNIIFLYFLCSLVASDTYFSYSNIIHIFITSNIIYIFIIYKIFINIIYQDILL